MQYGSNQFINLMVLLVVFFLIAILFSFLCSILEAVLLSITPSYVQLKLKEDGNMGKLLKAYKDKIDRPLAGILTLNTFAHTIGAAGVGAQASKLLEETGIEYIAIPYTNFTIGYLDFWSAIVGVLLTLAILILSEIIPKTLGANYWKQLAPFTVSTLRVILIALKPLVDLSEIITKGLKKDKEKSVLSKADFSAMAQLGLKEGVFQENESKIIDNLLRFGNVLVKDIMTPRMVVKAAPENMTIQDFHEQNKDLHFSRIPIYKDNIDGVTGFILRDELLLNIINGGGHLKLKDIGREILIVHENTQIPFAFNKLMENRAQIALVLDEFGGMEGLITMEDIIETLLGLEIIDEMDSTADMQALARRNWQKRAKRLGIIDNKALKEEEAKAKKVKPDTDKNDTNA